ncbi:terminase small subunit, Nu1 [Methylocystis sp. FS]|uniref:terminase small subunit, Nu1 n=1 Tax=Methylocystis silviterrae TaxID=2743612 RepID=UPI0015824CB8|nr:terminase small subunit, Nu1 [Methylocystis silviterrae]NUJ82046.1 terminase small subunit, Nu1 [Methylocystis silviterrae]
MNELPTTVAAATLAKLLGLSTRRIQQLAEAGVIPKPGKRGEYRLVESVAGYLKWLRSDAGNGTPDFQKERTRLTQARARLAELEYDRESGLVVEVEESIRQIREEYSIVRTRLLAVPSKAAPRLLNIANPEKVRALLDAEIRDTLSALTADGPEQNSAAVAARARARKASRK